MKGLNITYAKLDDGEMAMVSKEIVEIPDILPEPDLDDLLFRIFQRLEALELKSERLT